MDYSDLKMKFLTVEQLAEFAHCSVRYIHLEKQRGVLRCHKVGRRILFSHEDVLKWLNRKTQTPA